MSSATVLFTGQDLVTGVTVMPNISPGADVVNRAGKLDRQGSAMPRLTPKRRTEQDLTLVPVYSVHDQFPWAGQVNYAASKGGIAMLMKTMAQELAQYHIRVNSIAPGAIKTPINKSAWDSTDAEQELLKLIPYGRNSAAYCAEWAPEDMRRNTVPYTQAADGTRPGFRARFPRESVAQTLDFQTPLPARGLLAAESSSTTLTFDGLFDRLPAKCRSCGIGIANRHEQTKPSVAAWRTSG
jgi:NAD(P)-dependent dehydrogenase (short-subunit alcohol dehydrogenase family)